MGYLLEIAGTGLAAVTLHPLRSAVSFLAVVAVLVPYLVGLGLSRGIETQAEASARYGADLYVTGSRFGRSAPLPLSAADAVSRLEGVTAVAPRIVGEVVLGKAPDLVRAVLVGLPPRDFPAWAECVEGELPRDGGAYQLVVGSVLARRLKLKIGDYYPPLSHNRRGDRTALVVGIFKTDCPLWQANLILTTFDAASYVFDQPGSATDLLVSCRPGYREAVTRAIGHLSLPASEKEGVVRPRVTAREDLLVLLPRGPFHREGIFNLHFLLAFTVAILVLLVTSGLGETERRREIGILKATGWQTDEVLLRGAVESFALSLAGACTALLLAWVWLRLFNAWGVAGYFLDGAGLAPDLPVPFRLTPVPALLAFLLSFAIVLTGTLYSAWRAATAAPREVMR
jgi:ABC-type lipoprotein release transport system permease subunit